MENIWLAPIKPTSWPIIKQNGVYGVPLSKKKYLDEVKENDFIAFYIYPPINGIIGISKVISKPFIDNSILWSKSGLSDKYSYRVKIIILNKYMLKRSKVIPLYEIIGYKNNKKNFIIEPYLRNIMLLKLSKNDSDILFNSFENKNIQNNDYHFPNYLNHLPSKCAKR